jgi:hypothetical protein
MTVERFTLNLVLPAGSLMDSQQMQGGDFPSASLGFAAAFRAAERLSAN